MSNTIVTCRWLAEKIGSSAKNLRVLDGSWHLPSTGRVGRKEYDNEHIKGALYFDIDECADQGATNLSHMLPKPEGKEYNQLESSSICLYRQFPLS